MCIRTRRWSIVFEDNYYKRARALMRSATVFRVHQVFMKD